MDTSDRSPIVSGPFCVRLPPRRNNGTSPAERVVNGQEDGLRHPCPSRLSVPTYLGSYTEPTFILEAVNTLWGLLRNLQEEAGMSPILVGLSGGKTPRDIFSCFNALCAAGRNVSQRNKDTDTRLSGAAATATALATHALPTPGLSPQLTPGPTHVAGLGIPTPVGVQRTLHTDSVRDALPPGTGSLPVTSSAASLASLVHTEETEGSLDWDRIILFLVDERYVAPDHPDSNQRMVRESLLRGDAIPIPHENLVFPNTTLPLEQCIQDYQVKLLRALRKSGRLNLVTLGLGDDGHIASWFPPLSPAEFELASNGPLVSHTTQERFAVRDRITVSLRFLASADERLFYLFGDPKIQRWNELRNLDFKVREIFQAQPLLPVLENSGVTVVSCPPIIRDADVVAVRNCCKNGHMSVVIFGASGDLASKKTVPALFSLFCEGFLPDNFTIIGYARSKLSESDLWQKFRPHLENLELFFKGTKRHQRLAVTETHLGLLEKFRNRLTYVCGNYDDDAGFKSLQEKLDSLEKNISGPCPRLFYLALPPNVFATVVRSARKYCWRSANNSPGSWRRVIVEKPFGRDSASAEKLSNELLQVLNEKETYRIDHYLGKEMVLSLFTLRFANTTFGPLFCADRVSAVRITFKESMGTEGRGGYFDEYGIIRDIIQNHLLQVLMIFAMERPASLMGEDIRDEKIKVLKQMPPICIRLPLDLNQRKDCFAAHRECIVGQYTRSRPDVRNGYTDDPGVPENSICPTFCTCVCRIHNERWQGVPFILKAGKALEERLTEIRIQFKPVPPTLFGPEVPQNEMVIRVQPTEAIYLKMMTKQPGHSRNMVQSELDLTLHNRFSFDRLPDAYERLLLDVMRGEQQNFVRTDELLEAWRIFTPLLHHLEAEQIKPIPYPAGGRGPAESDELITQAGYVRYQGYQWGEKNGATQSPVQ